VKKQMANDLGDIRAVGIDVDLSGLKKGTQEAANQVKVSAKEIEKAMADIVDSMAKSGQQVRITAQQYKELSVQAEKQVVAEKKAAKAIQEQTEATKKAIAGDKERTSALTYEYMTRKKMAEDEAKAVKKAAEDQAKAVQKAANEMKAAWGAVAIAATMALKSAIKSGQDYITTILNMSRNTGLSVSSASKLSYTANELGINLTALQRNFVLMERRLTETETSSSKTKNAFDELGITIKDSNGKLLPLDQILYNVSDKFHSMPDGIEKTGMATKLFSQAGHGMSTNLSEMIRLLNLGSDSLKAMGMDANALGYIINDSKAKMQQWQNSSNTLNAALTGIKIQITEALLPIIIALNNMISNIIIAFNKLNPAVKQVIIVLASLTATIAAVTLGGAALKTVFGIDIVKVFQGLKTTIAALFAPITTLISELWALHAAWLAGLGPVGWVIAALEAVAVVVGAFTLAWRTNFGDMKKATAIYLTNIINDFKNFVSGLTVIGSGIGKIFQGIIESFNDPKKGWRTMLDGANQVKNGWNTALNGIKDTAVDTWGLMGAASQSAVKGVTDAVKKFTSTNVKVPSIITGNESPGLTSGSSTAGQQDAYQKAKALYEEDAAAYGRTVSQKIALYKKYLTDVKKTAAEESDYKKGLAKLEAESDKQSKEVADINSKAELDAELNKIDMQEDAIKVRYNSGKITQKKELADIDNQEKEKYNLNKTYLNKQLQTLVNTHQQETTKYAQLNAQLKDLDDERARQHSQSLAEQDAATEDPYKKAKTLYEKDSSAYETTISKKIKLYKQYLISFKDNAKYGADYEKGLAELTAAYDKQSFDTKQINSERELNTELNNLDIKENNIKAKNAQDLLNHAYTEKEKEKINKQELINVDQIERQKYEANLKYLNDQLKVLADANQQETTKYAQLVSKIKELQDRRKLQHQQMLNEEVAAEKTAQQRIVEISNDIKQSLTSNFQTAFEQMEAKTYEWKNFFSNVWNALGSAVLSSINKMVADWLAGEIAKRAASWATVAANKLIAGQQAKTSAAAGSGAATAMIQTNATAFEGTLGMLQAMAAAVATILPAGPALAASMQAGIGAAQGMLTASTAAATASIAAIGAGAAGLSSFDVGSWNVPMDQLAMVHQGEQIVPKNFAEKVRETGSLAGNAAGGNIININANDAKSFEKQLKNSSSTIYKILVEGKRDFAYNG
jgi:hypothetical protein